MTCRSCPVSLCQAKSNELALVKANVVIFGFIEFCDIIDVYKRRIDDNCQGGEGGCGVC